MTQKRQFHSAEFKRDAVDLWQNSSHSASQVENELGLSKGILYKWQKQLAREGDEAFSGNGKG